MQKVMVIGSPGAGKSTLARKLAERTGLPLWHLDAEHWLPGWIPREESDWLERQRSIVEQESWIIDGNHGDSLELRSRRADTVIWLDYPATICLWRAAKRMVVSRGQVLPDAAPDCPESIDLEFLLFIASFRSRKRELITSALHCFDGEVLQFRHPSDAERWIGGLAQRVS